MYAITFNLDTKDEIKQALAEHGFSRQQGSVYFGDEDRVNAVSTVLAVQEVAKQFPWFRKVVRDIHMLRIEENNDLRVALEAVNLGPLALAQRLR